MAPTRLCAVALVASVLVGVLPGAPAAADALYQRLAAGNESRAAALAEILESPGSVDAVSLLFASSVAIEKGQLEDAGYLFYLGQLRGKADLASLPPVDVGGNSPEVLLGALHEQIGMRINPPLTRDRRAYAFVLERMRSSKPDYGPTYSPGWKFKTRVASPEAEATFFELRSSLLEHMTKMKTLLDDEKAYQALLAIQDCNLPSDPAPDCDARRRAAEEELRAAERRHGLEDFLGF